MDAAETSRIISNFLKTEPPELDSKVDKIFQYYALLEEWNKKLNLVKLKGWDDFLERHILDSISPLRWGLIGEGKSLCDIGTGGGLPGVPIKLMLPGVEAALVESKRKKIVAIDSIIQKMGLRGIRTVCSRAEALGVENEWKDRFDVVTIRAVGKEEEVKSLAYPLVKDGGICIIYQTAEKRRGKNVNKEEERGFYRYSFEGLRKDRVLAVVKRAMKVPRGTGG